jgi:uncharacterized protein (DUF1499 family)
MHKIFTIIKKLLYAAIAIVLLLAIAYAANLEYMVQTRAAPEGFGKGLSAIVCPTDKPNCVSSVNVEKEFNAKTFKFEGDAETAFMQLKKAIASQPRTEIVFEDSQRIEVVFKSFIFRYRDDVVFVMHPETKTLDFRSKSRVGYSDLGVNRERIERLRIAFGSAR